MALKHIYQRTKMITLGWDHNFKKEYPMVVLFPKEKMGHFFLSRKKPHGKGGLAEDNTFSFTKRIPVPFVNFFTIFWTNLYSVYQETELQRKMLEMLLHLKK